MASSSIRHRLAADEIHQALEPSSSSASYSSDDAFVPVFRPDPCAASASAAAAVADRVRSLFRSLEIDLLCDALFAPRTEDLGFTDEFADDDASIHWDCLELEDAEPDLPLVSTAAGYEFFEWEEVPSASTSAAGGAEPEWEVLAADVPPQPAAAAEEEGFVYTSDRAAYEVLVAGSGEGLFVKSKPPAARSAVEALGSAVVAAGEEGEGAECAVCRDGVAAGQRVKRLPCSHLYHDDCILPWLQVRNSCPLCRFELPTDDPEYETWKAGRAVAA